LTPNLSSPLLKNPFTLGVFAALAGFFLASCFSPASKACKTGLVCPDGTVCSEDGKTCVAENKQCGNRAVNPGEKCDDGNTLSGDGCNADCTSDEKCGTGFKDPNEVCDDGNNVSGDNCSKDCQSNEICGNAILDNTAPKDEVCDDGNTVEGDGCSANCRSKETCGNGVLDNKFIDPARHEACDDGNLINGDGCSQDCKVEGCGNGILDNTPPLGQEVCDDGNTVGGDGCSANCRSNETCGNGTTDPLRGEKCDDTNTISGDGCSGDCRSTEGCGNAYKDTARNEVCDDGNADGGDGCSADCRSTEICGNAYLDTIRGEVCDDGNLDGGDGCSFDCRSTEVCGNFYRDIIKGELCDDGNTNSGDGCASDCKSTEICGNTILDTAAGEVCDDGNTSDGPDGGDGCSANCRSNQNCGNGTTDVIRGEVCDDNNTNNGDGCSSNCKSNERCGNNIVDNAVGEICDDGNTTSFYPDGGLDTCAADCKSGQGCGNGIRDLGEDCDDGNQNNDDNCLNSCTFGFCGDTFTDLQLPRVEQCDTAGESLTCNANCTNAYCGDGIVNITRSEQCDVASTDGGVDGGTETSNCDQDCTVAFCGDGTRNVVRGEQCDTAGNSSTCDSNCTTAVCGDSFLNPSAGEQCDTGRDTPLCDDDCTPVSCGDAHPNADAGEQCDDGNQTNNDYCLTDCRANICGDGFRDQTGKPDGGPPEACDDGNTSTELNCSYGTSTCNVCRNDCLALVPRTGAFCGDNSINGTLPDAGVIEKCDDGNAVTETQCPYGFPTCSRCDSNCQTILNLAGPRCGDNSIDPFGDGGTEACDDGNTALENNCPYGTASCNVCNATCTATVARTGAVCGDNSTNGTLPDGGTIEKCDDGNTVTETACPYGTASCARCDNSCQTILNLIGPRCGDNGIDNLPDGGVEACDDGNVVLENNCPYGTASCNVCNATCDTTVARTGAVCGDSSTNGTLPDGGTIEKCDDGNAVTETSCGYGVPSCSACDGTCQTILNLVGARCGDGNTDNLPDGGVEACDDGNNTTEAACPYGQASCTRCDATCENSLNLTGPFCGDSLVTNAEVCDDGNALTCGGCNATCTAVQNSAAATGTIRSLRKNDLVDGQLFTLGDGVHPVVVFEFDTGVPLADGGFSIDAGAGHVRVDANTPANTDTAEGDAIVAAINNKRADGGLDVTATKAGTQPHVRLTNDEVGAFGNVAMTENVVNTGFAVVGMSGGGGFDCGVDAGCVTDSDCALPNVCRTGSTDGGTLPDGGILDGHCLP
jgi:cysteine-rich repeat protein